MKTREDTHKSFEFWFFNVATEGERKLPNEVQTEAHQMWLMQEEAWFATIDDIEESGTDSDSFDFR